MDYVALHKILRDKNKKAFENFYGMKPDDEDEIWDQIYQSWKRIPGLDKKWFDSDVKTIEKYNLRVLLVQQLTRVQPGADENWAFITIGWNEQTVTPRSMLDVSKRVAELKYFSECKFVLEKHRENGIHHHTHFLVRFNEKYFKSKLIGWMYQVRGLRAICLGKNFIDIKGPLDKKKPYQSYELYNDYVSGIKTEEKNKYIEKDRIWRQQNNIEDIYIL